ncbi:MAG: zinc ribbon domain-containing protein [Nitrospirae bacterium]|nr:zinc ribbon domain-containing protein [Nitrospirota bacterium]MBI3594591.1 zinc ribbon domain-containing protein [Nitrospirota bacterium]
MPIYEYECEKCSHRFELIQKFSDAPILECPKCQGLVRKIISTPGILFKGSGWYVTDYSKKLKNPVEESKPKPDSAEKKSPEPAGSSKEGTSPAPAAPTPSEKKSDSPVKPSKSE